jgi:ribosomal protein S18 acetylase RimI-like enzyme
MRLRRARPEDLAAVGEVTVAAYAEFGHDNPDEYVELLRDGARRDSEAEVWVATPDDSEQVLGSVTICPEGSVWREVSKPGEGEFRMLGVAPEARGGGVGAALVELVVERFRADGAGAIVMSTLPTMRSAHRIYEAAGFVRAPDLDWSPTDEVQLLGYRLELR